MRWTRVCSVAGALGIAGVLLLPGMASAEDKVAIAGADDKIEPGSTIDIDVNCDKGEVRASVWYSAKGSTDKRGETSVKTDADGKGRADIALPNDLPKGTYSVSVRCGDTNIVKNDFTVIATDDKSASPSQDKSLAVSPSTVAPGGTITVTGYCEGKTTEAKVWYGTADDPGRALSEKSGITAAGDGRVSQALVVTDSTRPGSYEGSLRCTADGKTQTAGFTVSSGGTTAGDGSAAVGDGMTLALVGGGMLAAAALGGAIYMQRRGLGVSV